MIHFLPIEPLEQRYSTQWTAWFERAFREHRLPFATWMGDPVSDNIGTGQFLDVYGTNVFKLTQLSRLIGATMAGRGIKDGDVVFLMDMWMPGLESLAYVRQGAGIDFKIAGILHDGTYNPADFLHQRGMEAWARPLEESWFTFMDHIYVGTHFHREFLLTKRDVDNSMFKLLVTGLPIDIAAITAPPEEHRIIDVIFPHRIAPEKHPERFDDLCERNPRWCNYRHRARTPVLSKSAYYRKMAMSNVAISYADQEMFGISMLEACANGCLPLVPDRLAYSEIYPEVFKYKEEEERDLTSRVKFLIAHRQELEPLARSIPLRFVGAIPRMLSHLRELHRPPDTKEVSGT